MNAGLPDLLPSLIRPEQIGISSLMLETQNQIMSGEVPCFPPESLPPLAAALAQYVEEGPDGILQVLVDQATYCLGMVVNRLPEDQRDALQLSARCVTRMAGVMVSGDEREAVYAYTNICTQVRGARSAEVLTAALSSGGFVPGLVRLASVEHMAAEVGFQLSVVCAPSMIARWCEEPYISQAINSGLLSVLEPYLDKPKY